MKKVYFQNREASWLKFNERVLEEAREDIPSLEKLKFISIFVSNLDEFFMVRVGSLYALSNIKKNVIDNKTKMTPKEQIDLILSMLPNIYAKKDEFYKNVCEELDSKNIRELKYKELDKKQKEFILEFYMREIDELVSAQIIDMNHPFPFLENNKLYIIAKLKKEDKKVYGIVPVRNSYPNFVILPGEKFDYILIENILLNQIERIFSGYEILNKSIIKVTRNYDFKDERDTKEEFDDYQEYIKSILKRRKRLNIVRIESDINIDDDTVEFLMQKTDLKKDSIFKLNSPLNMNYVFKLIDTIPKAIKELLLYKEFTQYNSTKNIKSIISHVKTKDLFLSYPYESMNSFIDLLKEAANDSDVKSIKITIYRLAKNSKIVKYLCEAAQNGKEVTVFVELKARFDEESNINYANILYEEGCNIIYGFNEYKIHSKICLISFKNKRGKLSYITQIGTGNYNESTAKQYSDFSLITANHGIGLDAMEFFKNMSLGNLNGKYKYLLQSPTSLKSALMKCIENEIEKREDGYIICKLNSLTDKDFIEKFVEASQNGVKITLIIRGISCLVPGIKNYSENIEIISIVGRFLEHPRVYVFGKNYDEVYISSADLMTRNTEKRVEIAAPILDEKIKNKIVNYLKIQLKDNVCARTMNNKGKYEKIKDANSDMTNMRFSSQEFFISKAEENLRNDADREDKKENFLEKIQAIFRK